MKFVCERCQTRYSIADDKVRQKILKIRCKTCESVITVRDPAMQDPAPQGLKGLVPQSAVVTASKASAAVSAPVVRSPTSVRVPVASPPAALPVEWFFSIDGNQQGPFGQPELVRRIVAANRDNDVHVWKEDFDAWKELKTVGPIRREVAAARAPKVRPPSPSWPSVPAPPSDFESDDSSTHVSAAAPSFFAPVRPDPAAPQPRVWAADHSRKSTVRLATPMDMRGGGSGLERRPDLATAARDTPSPLAMLTPPPVATSPGPTPPPHLATPLPGTSPASNGHSSGLFADPLRPPTPGLAAVALAHRTGTMFPVTSVGSSAALSTGISQLYRVSGPLLRYPVLKFVLAGVVLVGLLIVVMLTTLDHKDAVTARRAPKSGASTSAASIDPEQQARLDAAQRFRRTVGTDDSPLATPPPTKIVLQGRRVLVGTSSRSAKAAATLVVPPPVGSVQPPPAEGTLTEEQKIASRQFAESERKVAAPAMARAASRLVGPESFSQEDIRGVVKRNEGSIKTCYERALKREEGLRAGGRLEVTVSVGTSGRVKKVSVNASAALASVSQCVQDAVRRWVFPSGREEYESTFPFLLHGSE